MRLILIRHGESEGNYANRLSEAGKIKTLNRLYHQRHSYHLRLSDKGRSQALMAGEWFREKFGNIAARSHFVVSEYVRARETAALLGIPGARWHLHRHLVERDWGDLEKFSSEDRLKKFGDNIRGRRVEPFYWRPQGGETMAEVCERVSTFIEHLKRDYSDKTVVVVCHGEVMWAFRIVLEHMSVEKFRSMILSKESIHQIYNCQVHIYEYVARLGVSNTTLLVSGYRPTDNPPSLLFNETIDVGLQGYSNEELMAGVIQHPNHFPLTE